MNPIFSIAIDGPAGAGKSTIAKAVAKELGGHHLNTGAMYRALGLYLIRNGIDPDDEKAVEAVCGKVDITVDFAGDEQRTLLCGEDVSGQIYNEECGNAASHLSQFAPVRRHMVAMQQAIAKGRSIVVDGRDICSYVLPDATVKIYLTATPEVRAQRRYDELTQKGFNVDYDEILSGIIERDNKDMNREVAPLVKADDAIEMDTSSMTPDEEVRFITRIARERI